MNDDALHSLRQDPPAAFASSLRARLQTADTCTQEERRALRTAWLKPLVAVASVAALFAIPAVRKVPGLYQRRLDRWIATGTE